MPERGADNRAVGAADEEAGFLADLAVDGVIANHGAGEKIDMERSILPTRPNQRLPEPQRPWIVLGLVNRRRVGTSRVIVWRT